MKYTLIKSTIFLVLLSLAVSSLATDLRGRLRGYNSYYNSFYPASGVQVIFSQWDGYKWSPIAKTYTQRDGMYYISLYPGNYYIQAPGINLPLTVYNTPAQDIPEIQLPN
jgi:hypothetical protein